MKMRTCLAAVALSLGLSTMAMAQVTGKVTVQGKAPALPKIQMNGDPNCMKAHGGKAVPDPALTIGAQGELANVVVSIDLTDDAKVPKALPKGEVVLDQKGCMYDPHVVAMMAGQKLMLKNSDGFLHNVHSLATDNDGFNTAMPNKGEQKAPHQPKVPEYIHFVCNVHPWMSAWVAVFTHPYFAVTAADGTYTIPAGLPDGDYKIKFWHERDQDGIIVPVTIKDGKATVNQVFKADDLKGQ